MAGRALVTAAVVAASAGCSWGDDDVSVGPETSGLSSLPVEQVRPICDALEPLAVRTLRGEVHRLTDVSGCGYLLREGRPAKAMTLFAVTGEREALDAFTDQFYAGNGTVTSLSARAGLTREPDIPVPGHGVVSSIDCGGEVVFLLVQPPHGDVAAATLQAERLLCSL